MIRAQILFFAHLTDRYGKTAMVEVAEGATMRDALAAVADDGEIPGYCRVAKNSRMVGWDVRVEDGDEIAILPPVSGG